MRRKWISVLCALAAALTLAVASNASADVTLGSTTQPGGSTPRACSTTSVIAQTLSASDTPYPAPAGGGLITQWQTDTTADTAGNALTLVVLRRLTDSTYSVVGVDAEHLPTPLPASNLASFTPSSPIAVAGGDLLGLGGDAGSKCFWSGGATPPFDELIALGTPAPAAPGQTLTFAEASNAGFTLNLAATLVQREDAGVTTSASPASVTVGNVALLGSMVTTAGPTTTPITFTDTVPTGLTVDAATAGSGSCMISGRLVTCTISGLGIGQTAPVNIVVTPTSAKQYTNTVAVSTGAAVSDPNTANNTASATLLAGVPVPPKCIVPVLARTPLSVARGVLVPLNCKVGKVTHAFSNSIAKGLVIKTSPRAGSYPNRRAVTLQVSSGRKPKKRHRR